MHRFALCVTLALMFAAGQAWGQASPNPPQDPGNPWAMWNVQQMIDRASGQIVKRYSLTPEQETFTRNLMATRVNTFLDKHEQEIREIFTEAMKHHLAGNAPPAEKVQEWTQRINPMFEEAKQQIVEGNQEFREILSDEQKKIHDIDLKVMQQNFKDAEKRLTRWGEGGFDEQKDLGRRPGQGGAPRPSTPRQTPPAVEPAAPETAVQPGPQPTPMVRTPRINGPSSVSAPMSTDAWEMYVRRFITNYRLDAAQSSQALSILGESKKRADEYRASRRGDYDRLQSLIARDPAKSAESQKQLKALDEPIDKILGEMKQRLEQIPTEAQRKAYEEIRAANTKWRDQAGDKAIKGPATQSTQPARSAASRPARPNLRPSARGAQTRPAATQPAARR